MAKMRLVPMLAFMSVAGAAQAAPIPPNIQFDGYCDGMIGLTVVGTTGAAGRWTNLDCIGTTVAVGGPQGKGTGESAKGYVLASFGVGVLYGAEFVWLINKDGTWTTYRANDGVRMNQGTWTAVAEGATPVRGTKPSIQR